MRVPKLLGPEVALLIAVALMVASLVYLWTQAQSSSERLAEATDQLALLDEDAVQEQIAELEHQLEQARETPAPDPFPTRQEVVQNIATLREVLVASQVQLTSFSLEETSANLDGTGSTTRTYPGLVLDLVALGTPEAHLALVGGIQEQLPNMVLGDVALTRPAGLEGDSFQIAISMVLYHQPDEP